MKRDLFWTPFVILLIRDIKRFYKVKIQTILMPLINQCLYLVIFGVSLGQVIELNENFTYLQFLIPGLITLSFTNGSFQNGSSSIFVMKITGDIIDIKSTSLKIQQIIWAFTLSGLLRGLIVGFLTLCVGEVFHYWYQGSWLPIHSMWGMVLFTVIGGCVFAKIGLSVGIWSKSFDHIGAIGGFVILPLIYLGGVFFDLDKLSLFWQKVSYFNPLFYFINGIRWSFLGEADVHPVEAFYFSIVSLVVVHIITYFITKKGRFYGWLRAFQKIFDDLNCR